MALCVLLGAVAHADGESGIRLPTDEATGASVAIDGDTAVVAALTPSLAAPRAVVFVRDGDSWKEQAVLTGDKTVNSEHLTAVAVAGDRVFMGVAGEFRDGPLHGVVYVYRRMGSDWVLETKLEEPTPQNHSRFGATVAADGDRVLVGAPNHADDYYGPDAGSGYVFKRDGNNWSLEAHLRGDGQLGASVALDGTTALLGAPVARDDYLLYTGAVYVFSFEAGGWGEAEILFASDRLERAQYGQSVALSGDRALVGAPGHSDGVPFAGAAYTLVNRSGSWQEEQVLPLGEAGERTWLGYSVALLGDTALIGSPYLGLRSQTSGGILTFQRSADTWTRCGTMLPGQSGELGGFGRAVALSSDAVLVAEGHPESRNVGSAYIFPRSPAGLGCQPPPDSDMETRSEDATMSAPDAGDGEQLGSAVAVHGNRAVVLGQGAAPAQVFARDKAGAWTWEANLDAPTDRGFEHGQSVAIFGNVVALMAQGSVRVFEKLEGAWTTVHISAQLQGFSDAAPMALSERNLIVGDRGHAFIYRKKGREWALEASFDDPVGGCCSNYGYAVAVHGDVAVVSDKGAHTADSDTASAIYIYVRLESRFRLGGRPNVEWTQAAKLTSGTDSLGAFGRAVALYEDTLLVGNLGKVHVFELDDGLFVEQGPILAPGVQDGTLTIDNAAGFGTSLALWGDAMAIGWPQGARGGMFSGTAYLYKRHKGEWAQESELVASNGTGGDRFGASIALYRGAVLVGAPGGDAAGTEAGVAYFYEGPAEQGGFGCSARGRSGGRGQLAFLVLCIVLGLRRSRIRLAGGDL